LAEFGIDTLEKKRLAFVQDFHAAMSNRQSFNQLVKISSTQTSGIRKGNASRGRSLFFSADRKSLATSRLWRLKCLPSMRHRSRDGTGYGPDPRGDERTIGA
jgi:hypothetical protein